MKAANALETANFKIDKTLQNRHAELAQTLDRLSGKADEFSTLRRRLFLDHRRLAVGSRPARPQRAGAHARAHQRRERAHAGRSAPPPDLGVDDHDHRARLAVEPLRRHVRGDAPAGLARRRRHRRRAGAPAQQMERLPVAAHESSEGMRRALHDQIKALDQLSQLAARSAVQRDVTRRRRRSSTPRRCRPTPHAPPRARARRARSPRCRRPSRRSSATGSASAAPARRQPRRLVARRSAGARLAR